MPLSQFADPSVAIEPPPQDNDFEALIQAQAAMSNPFDMSWLDPPNYSTVPASKSWTDIITDVGRGFVTDLAHAIGGKVSGYNPNDPNQVAALAAAREREAKAEQQKMFIIVGGVAAAVVVGVLVLRKGKR